MLHYFIGGNLAEDVSISIDCLFPIALGTITMFIAFNFSKLNSIGKNGDYSYGVYIFHFPLIQIFITFGCFQVNKNISILIIIGVVFSIAYISWHFLEKKVLKRTQ
jgi:peptidoglycan/LPS O-acetylase OafA/YrhL